MKRHGQRGAATAPHRVPIKSFFALHTELLAVPHLRRICYLFR
jgi:hypothetical protein